MIDLTEQLRALWQPIDTAPKGEIIIGYFPPIANVHETYNLMVQETWWAGDRWMTVHPEQQPTHWMPMPPPPINEAVTDDKK